MKNVLQYIVTALFVFILNGCGAATLVHNIDNRNTLDQKSSMQQVEDAIQQGALRKSWTIKKEKEGLLSATLNVRGGKHIAIVSIAYDTKGYSINYKESHGLDYDASANTIHKSYNKWIATLEKNINYELARVGVQQTHSSIGVTNPKPQATPSSTTQFKKAGGLNIEGKTLYIKSVIPYASSSQVAENIKAECILDQQLSEFIVASAQASGFNVVVKNDIGKNDIELKVEIIDAVSQGGVMRGHNKYVSIRGVLVQGAKEYQSFKAARISGGGFWGAYKSSCAVLGRTVEALGKDTGTWLAHPIDGALLGDRYLLK